MRRKGFVLAALVMAACLLIGAMPALAATQTQTVQATMPPATVSGSVEGTVLDVEANDIMINMDNGNTISFMMNYISTTEAAVGDKVKIEYSGDVTNMPEAVTITVLAKSATQVISGEVMQHGTENIFIKINSQNIFGLYLTKETTISGADTKILNGATVKITYTGDLHGLATAINVEIVKAGKPEKTDNSGKKAQEDTTNKSLDGYATKVSDTAFTIYTSRSKSYSFQITGNTRFTGGYCLEVGSRVVVTYDGYASKKPPAKVVNVIAPPDPNPTPAPVYKTVSGTIDSYYGYGAYMTLTNGMYFDLTGAVVTGDTDAGPGDKAQITYYVGSDGVNYGTYVVLTQVDYEPDPEPWPPEPDPDPDPIVYEGDEESAAIDAGIAE